jgi:hypothetical protein
MKKKIAVACLTILALVFVFSRSECFAIDNHEATMTLKNYLSTGSFEIDKVKALLDQGADVNAADDHRNWTLLINASRLGHLDAVKLLLANGAEVNKADKFGSTPLLAASRPFVGYFKIKGSIELMCAATQDRIEIVKLLLANGAEANRANNEGVTPLFVARIYDCSQIVDLLKKHGAKELPRGKEMILRKKFRAQKVEDNFKMLEKGRTIAQVSCLIGPFLDIPDPYDFYNDLELGDFRLETDLYTLIFVDGKLNCWKGNCKECVWQDSFLRGDFSTCSRLDARLKEKR